MIARIAAARSLIAIAAVDRIADLGLTCADAAVVVVAVAEVRRVDAADRDADEVFAFFADQLAAGEKLAQVVTDLAFDDLSKALMVFVDLEVHKPPRTREST